MTFQITEEWRQIDYHDPDAAVMGIIKITDVSMPAVVYSNRKLFIWTTTVHQYLSWCILF